MRRFSSYGPINTKLDYHAPRKELIERAYSRLTGERTDEDGHYITVWAPRQCGKTWVMQEAVQKIRKSGNYEVGIITMERAKEVKKEKDVLEILIEKLQSTFEKSLPQIKTFKKIPTLFTKQNFQKPVILIIDEFDALEEVFINRFAGIFRDMYISRTNESNKPSRDKTFLLHGLALIGVRSVLGIENKSGSPFNVQRSLHIPNLTFDETMGIFQWYEKESGQNVEQDVLDRLFYETNGQPGLTCWFGELLTETYNEEKEKPITMKRFKYVFTEATHVLPNNNILNIISKAKEEPYKDLVLKLFKTDRKIEFRYDDEELNYLYMNGIIDIDRQTNDKGESEVYCKFSNPFVQGRLFNYFARKLFGYMGTLVEPFRNMDDVVTETDLNIRNLMKLYQTYLEKNKEWLFKDAPRRNDLKIYEAVYHFNLFSYLYEFLRDKGGGVLPEFPTGNGKIDLIVKYGGKMYGLELKSFTDHAAHQISLKQAARYGKQLNLSEVFLLVFVPAIDETNRNKYETDYRDTETKVTVKPIFIETGN